MQFNPFAVKTLALREARKEVEASLRPRNVKVQSLSYRELMEWSELYLADHREEMMASAQRVVAQWNSCKAR